MKRASCWWMHALLAAAVVLILEASVEAADPPTAERGITLETLLEEMIDRDALARFPDPLYQSLQASSYNRQSVHRDQPGWFADSDGLGFIRTETVDGQTEWVIMEHDGPRRRRHARP